MKFSNIGFPLVILSHRGQRYLPHAVRSLRQMASYITDVIVVDDSGDPEHHQWLDDHGYQYSLTGPSGKYTGLGGGYGYLESMKRVWEVSRNAADEAGVEYVMLWEEDFMLRRRVSLLNMYMVMQANPQLAHLNLQRQSVYKVERQHGYMESHQLRGYGLSLGRDSNVDWVSRRTPFTTNPGLIRREVLDIDWPTRAVCDLYDGGAEPAMSHVLEEAGYHFGWLGRWNRPVTQHIGTERKSGTGY